MFLLKPSISKNGSVSKYIVKIHTIPGIKIGIIDYWM
jgi:hypothetical protein